MRVFVLLFEHRRCVNHGVKGESQCWDLTKCPHEKRLVWEFENQSMKEGVLLAQITSLAKTVKMYPNRSETGRADIRYADVFDLPSALNEAEQAALRIGGTEAVRKMREVEARERAKANGTYVPKKKPNPAHKGHARWCSLRKGRACTCKMQAEAG